jgi:hypothetical protein
VRRAHQVLVALLAAALVLIGVEVARGLSTHPRTIADPCRRALTARAGGVDAAIQSVVLAGLDRAACRLHTSREALVLAIGGSPIGGGPHWSRATIETAVRAGLHGALDEAARRGDVPRFAVPYLARFIDAAPIDTLVRAGVRLSDLIG